ncbi:MAG: PorV/PorQ family protein [candidate division Zixibacteria bacterium]|nr:PorV/PorQ family protein [candidate division Zixibacteria bacterium]
MRKALFGIVILFLLVSPELVWGQAKVGTAGAQFLELGVSARAIAMGEAFLSICDDASAVYYNPAGLSQLMERQAMFTHVSYPAEINYDFVALAYPAPRFGGVWGVGFTMLNAGDMPYFGDYEVGLSPTQTFTAKDYALSLSYARSLTDRFNVGVTVKIIDELYDTERATGWAVDVGTLYDTGFKGFKIGMMISNFGPDLTFIDESYPLPMNFRFGGVVDVIRRGDHSAVFAVEGSHPNDNMEKFNAGVEYWFREIFALRFGNYFEYDEGGISTGGGLKFNVSRAAMSVDYGYHDMGHLDNTHRFSVGIVF